MLTQNQPDKLTNDSSPIVQVQTTRYGKSVEAGGWDTYGDSETDKGFGAWGNLLTDNGCALTNSAKEALGASKFDYILLTWPDRTMTVQYQDIAPEENNRVDIYLPLADDPTIPDFGTAQLV